METDDVFSQGLEDGDDPFALADAEFEQARETVTDQPVEGIPVVNAEGQPVDPTAPTSTAAPATAGVTETPSSPAAPSATPAATSSAPVADPPPSAPTDGAQTAQPAAPHPDLGKTIGEVADEKAAKAEALSAAEEKADDLVAAGDETVAEAEVEVEDAKADPTPAAPAAAPVAAESVPAAEEKVEKAEEEMSVKADAASEGDLQEAKAEYNEALAENAPDPTPAAPTTPATPPAAPTGVAASEPAKKKDSGFRRYLLFTPTGAGKFSEVTWYQNAKGQIVEKGTEGAKKTSSVRARGQEEALRVGYAALGSPPEGAKLVAVAENYWAVKHVAPAEVVPARVKIDIR
jgi:hypothetical protein